MVPTQLGQFHAATHVASIVLGTRVPNGCRLPCREAVVKKKKMVEVCSDGFGWVRVSSDGYGWARTFSRTRQGPSAVKLVILSADQPVK